MAVINILIGTAIMAGVGLSQVVNGDTNTCNLALLPGDEFADSQSMLIHDQEYLDALLGNCTGIEGGLAIASDFNGTFSLPNIQMFTGEGIWLNSSSTPGLTGFDFPKLVILTNMSLGGMPALTNVSMPVLEQVEGFTLLGKSTVDIDCGKLVNANIIDIEAAALTANFTSLQQVNARLSIRPGSNSTDDAPPASLNFDSLTNAISISIAGHIAELNMPVLQTALASGYDGYLPYGIDVENYGYPLVLDFPHLSDASGIKLQGSFSNLNFPALKVLAGVFDFNSAIPFALNFTTLQAVVSIALTGEISSFSMSSITGIQSSVDVISSVDLDCSVAAIQYSHVSATTLIPSLSTERSFHCRSSAKQGMTVGQKAGMAIGFIVMLGVLLGTCVWAMKNHWRRKGRRTTVQEGATGCELVDMYKSPADVSTSERPPVYAASVHSDIGPYVEPKSAF